MIHFSSKLYGQDPVPSCNLMLAPPLCLLNTTCNLRIMVDSAETMSNHVSKLCKSASFALCKISRIIKKNYNSNALGLIHAFVGSRMDYCNRLLFGLPSREIRKIQIIKDYVDRLITKRRKYYHIIPTLQGLHWLPVHQRIRFKLIYLRYLNKLLSIYDPP